MLVLTRKVGEQISINNGEIMIVVKRMGSGQVRLGIIAPTHTKIDRVDELGTIENTRPAHEPA